MYIEYVYKEYRKKEFILNIKTTVPYRTLRYLKNNGLKATIARAKHGNTPPEPPKNDVIGFYGFVCNNETIPFNEKEYLRHKNDEKKIINWVIPEMSPGSGGHTTIFRFISNLEKMGFHSRVYLYMSNTFQDNASIRSFLKQYFPLLVPEVEVYCDVKYMKFAHATVATSWITAYYVKRFNNTISKFYFVQDFEPYFYAHGSEYEFAENTYKLGFRGITAGDWLRDIMRNEYGMSADSFHFSYDEKIYIPKEKPDDVKRVFFYARPVTPRRDFELGMLALNELTRRMPEVEVIFAGWDISNYLIPFKHQNLGTVTPQVLADSYTKCDMCLVISNTNLSLVPFEVMACNSVAVCSKGENSTWMLNEENSVLVDYEPIQIADTMEYYFNHPDELAKIRENGLNYVRQTSWQKEAEKVYESMLNGIMEDERKIRIN